MTEEEKDEIKNFIDSLRPLPSDKWRDRALLAERYLNDLKNTVMVGKGLQCSVSNLHDNVAKLVFRWNESENLRNQLTEIDSHLSKIKQLMGSNPVERVERLVFWYLNNAESNLRMDNELSDLKRYLLKLSEEFEQKSL